MARQKIRIAFDLDGVIVNKPPFIPKKLLEYLFRGPQKSKRLHYRFPRSRLEQFVRRLSHFYLFRPPIIDNIRLLEKLAADPRYELFIVSARYSFLKEATFAWLDYYGISRLFDSIFLNLDNEQPHLFKEKTLREINVDYFIDDDWLLADYLSSCNLGSEIICFDPHCVAVCHQAKALTRLSDFRFVEVSP